jgi:hypothetical protein
MGMLDQELMFSDGQSLAGAAIGDYPSTNTYDCGGTNGQSDFGQVGENLWFNMVLGAAVTSGGAATVQGVIQSAPDNATWTDFEAGPVVSLANAIAGAVLLQITPNPGAQRYLRTIVRVAGAALTGGTVNSFGSEAIQRNVSRNSGFAVS